MISETINKNILALADKAVNTGESSSVADFLLSIGFTPNNKSKIKNNTITFSHDQIYNAAKIMKVSIDWIYGLPGAKSKTPIDRIKEAVYELELRGRK